MMGNKIRRYLFVALCVSVLGGGSPVHAANHEKKQSMQNAKIGLYFPIGYAVGVYSKKLCNSYFKLVRQEFNGFKSSCNTVLNGFSFGAGYKVNEYFAVEAEYLGGISLGGGGGFTVEGNLKNGGGYGRGSASVAHQAIAYGIQVSSGSEFVLLGRIGVNQWKFDVVNNPGSTFEVVYKGDKAGKDLYYGFGITANPSDNEEWTFLLTRYGAGDDNVDYLAINYILAF